MRSIYAQLRNCDNKFYQFLTASRRSSLCTREPYKMAIFKRNIVVVGAIHESPEEKISSMMISLLWYISNFERKMIYGRAFIACGQF